MNKKIRRSKWDKQILIKLWNLGKNCTEIFEETGCPISSVNYILKKEGINTCAEKYKRRHFNKVCLKNLYGAKVRKLKLDVKKILELWNKGENTQSISESMKCSRPVVANLLKKEGIDVNVERYKRMRFNENSLKGLKTGIQGWKKNTAKKISKAMKGNTRMLGKKHSEETKEKMRQKALSRDCQYGKRTKPELLAKKLLEKLGIKFEAQKVIVDKFQVDFYLGDKNILEIDGRYWHTREDVKRKDKGRNAYLKKCGYTVYHIWDDELSESTLLDVIACVRNIRIQ